MGSIENGAYDDMYQETYALRPVVRLRAVSPNKSLQRSGTHKLLGRGRPSAERTRALRARVLEGRRAAAELCHWATWRHPCTLP